jgi:hypothetical protein
MKKNRRVSLVELYQSKGLLFPETENEVIAFENTNKFEDNQKPKDWDNPSAIIKKGKINKVNITN